MEKKIKTKDFVLRPIGINDAKNIYLFQQDAEAKKNLAWIPDSIERVKKDIIAELKKKDRETLVIDVEGQAVGEITLSMIIPNHKGKLGFWIAKEYRRKGIMTKAVKLATDYWFKKYRLKRIYANTRKWNKPSARVLEKAGFKFEGLIRKDVMKDGKYYDNLLFAKIR
ncbi:MAG: GNAT family N-acetyltransferase [Candidatus Micrarchaeia archaeon]